MTKPQFDDYYYEVWEKIPVPVVLSNFRGEIFYANRRTREHVEIEKNEVIGIPFFDASFVSANSLIQQLKEKGTGKIRAKLSSKTGKEFSAFIESRIITDISNREFVLSIFSDISLFVAEEIKLIEAQRETEYLYRQAEDLYQKLFENSPFAIIIINQDDFKISAVNKLAEQLLDEDAHKLANSKIENFIGNNLEFINIEANKFDNENKSYSFHEMKIITAKGKKKFIDGKLVSIELDKPSILILAHDLSWYTQREINTRLLYNAATFSQEAVLLLDMDYRITFVNEVFHELFEITQDEIVGNSIDLLKFFDDKKSEIQLSFDDYWSGDLYIKNKSNQFMSVSLSIYPSIEDDEIQGAAIMIRDISLQNQLVEYERQMKMLEFFGKLAGTFAGDMNNILSLIIGYPDFLKLTSTNQEAEKYVNELKKMANHAKHAFTSFFSLQEETAHSQELPDIENTLEKIIDTISIESSKRNKCFNIITPLNSKTTIQVNSELLTGILWALLQEISTSCLEEVIDLYLEKDENKIILRILFILDEETLSTNEFFKISEIKDYKYSTLLKKPYDLDFNFLTAVVQTFGGKLQKTLIENTSDNYEITFILPTEIHDTHLHSVDSKLNKFSMQDEKTYHEGQKILVVDDNSALGLLIKSFLIKAGYIVTVETNPVKALDFDTDFDLVIADLVMNPISGFEFYNRMRIRSDGIKPKGMFITGDLLDESMQKKIENINCEILLKPFEIEELLSTVRKVLNQSKNN